MLTHYILSHYIAHTYPFRNYFVSLFIDCLNKEEEGGIKRRVRNEETPDGEGSGEKTAMGRTHAEDE